MDTPGHLSCFIGHGEINQSRILLFLKRPSQGAFFFQIIVDRNKKTDPPQKNGCYYRSNLIQKEISTVF